MKLNFLRLKLILPLLFLLVGCRIPQTPSLVDDRPTASPSNPSTPSDSPDHSATPAPPASPVASVPSATPYPRRPFTLRDQVPTESSFYAFRQQLQQAIQNRDAQFMQAIADPDIKITFGTAVPFTSLGFDNPDSLSWKRLERIISIGCSPYEAPAGVEIDAYQCPHVSQAALGDPFSDVYIVGENVNVRAQPSSSSPVIGVVSNEVVQSDPTGFERLTQQQREEQQTVDGWQPIILPTGQRGYVSSRYAYTPAGYRARFENKDGQWKMTIFIAGD